MLPIRASQFRHEIDKLTGDSDDSQAKQRESNGKRATKLWITFFIAACAAFSASQYAYIYVYKYKLSSNFFAYPSRDLSEERDVIPLSNARPRNELERILRVVAPQMGGNKAEVLIAVCTINLAREGLLQMFLDTLLQSGVTNYLIVALDKELRDLMISKGINVYYYEIQGVQVYNHAVSAKKFRIIEGFLALGWSVLLSDIDVVVLRNPFNHLHRDHDVEAMTDGFDDTSSFGGSYGVDDPTMGWARYAQGFQHLNLNSGLFYVKANKRSLNLITKTAKSLEMIPEQWDQAVLNEQLFTLSHGNEINPGCTVRVMEREKFMNSKVLFKQFRQRAPAQMLGDHAPVMIHMNYHPNKGERMRGAIDFFIKGNLQALARFPGGSEVGS